MSAPACFQLRMEGGTLTDPNKLEKLLLDTQTQPSIVNVPFGETLYRRVSIYATEAFAVIAVTTTIMEFVPEHSPTILNASNHTIVVFLERGVLYNRQVLAPGEAVSMTKKQTGGMLVPYKVHAVIGDEKCLPTAKDSRKNLIKVTAIPAAFVTGCMLTAISAGMLVGPSAALGPLVSGMVVNGVVIDSAALAAGGIAATRAQAVTDRLLKEQPDKFMSKTNR